jgi:hypothetical protein
MSMNHVGALRVSMLLAIGVVPGACGGTVQRGEPDGEGADTGSGGSAFTGMGGTKVGTAGRNTGAGGTVGKMLPPSGGTGTGGATQTLPSCTGGQFDPSTGLVTCREGYTHRAVKVACVNGYAGAPADASAGASWGGAGGHGEPPVKPRTRGSVACGSFNAGGASGVEDCSRFELGYCNENENEFEPTCESGCVQDEDCGGGAICECGHPESPSGGICIDARDCSTNADCMVGYFCATHGDGGGCGYHAFSCMKPADDCWSNADCDDGGYCDRFGEQRVCNHGVCGRPFLVDSTARVAPVVSGGDWNASGEAPRVDHLTGDEREALARHWSRLGQMEHASIAAFARFNLQLLALGAPSQLVEQCTSALADETAHTKLCFRLASAYAGRALGPGPLDIDGSLAVSSLEEIVDLVLLEGCIGETSAALEALDAADTASDPIIRAAYTQIAADEQRHAELAFRFLRWALEQDAELVAARIAAALAVTERPRSAVRGVIDPCLGALLTLHQAA